MQTARREKMILTKPQKLIYDMEKFTGGTIAIVCGSMLINTDKSADEMKKTVNELYHLNDALRIRVSEENGQPYQYITEYKEQAVEVLSFNNKEELDDYASEYAKEPLDFYGSLCDVKIVVLPDKKGVLAKLHHFISDAWTLSLIGTQFNKILNGEEVQVYSYADYVESEEKYIESKRYAKDKDYFISQFKKCDEVTYISEKQAHTFEAKRATFVIDTENTSKILAYTKEKEVSSFSLFMSAVATYMNRVKMNADKFYIGTAIINRNGAKEQNTMGMFINTAPILIELNNEASFAENLNAVELSALSVLRHQKYNYGDLLEELRNNYKFNEKLYDIMLSYQNAKVLGDEVETTWYHSGMQTESLQIHIDDRDSEGIFRVHYDYLTEKFTEHEIAKIHEHICNLLFSAIEDDSKKIYELNILSSEEKQTLMFDFNDTAFDYPKDKCVHELFEEQAEKNPDKIAVVACDKTLTYKELNEEANRLAHPLVERGIGRGDIVAFMLPRRSYLIVTMLGILKSGAAYMPIDPDYPQDRIEYMLSDSGAKFCVTEKNISELLDNSNVNNPDAIVDSRDNCYCIYTSGSTGNPKGVLINHKNVSNFIFNNKTNHFQHSLLTNCDYILALNSITFDITLQEIHLPLLNSKTIVLLDENESINIEYSVDKFTPKKCGLIITPTKLSLYMKNSRFCESMSCFSVIMSGAESFPEHLLTEIRQFSNAIVFDGYGPTETTCGTVYSQVDDENNITIGKPIANTQIYIVDKYMKPVPIGVTGELCIAGDCVGAGYLNRPELTAEKFIDNPFGEGKIYKTGDLAYWREDGNIAYVGRNDFQVKIRGLRIELGEIENAISSVDGINLSVVVVRKNSEGRQLICAFYTGEEKSVQEIKAVIGEKLPKYMLPHIFTHLDEMPLTSSGKTNRNALPIVDLDNIGSDIEYKEPETPMQKALCKLLEQVFDTKQVGIADDFFDDLGGDSLKVIEFVAEAHSEGIYFALQNVFDYPTIEKLCEFIEKGDEVKLQFADYDYSKVNEVLIRNKVESISKPSKRDVGNILLAGATGYLGIHILADFLDNDNGIAYCLVRGENQEESEKRFNELLKFYFDDKYNNTDRIVVICADLQKDKFGLTETEYDELLGIVDTVINCAARVKHYGSYKYFYEANVETTKRLIEFTKQADVVLIHTSTLSVSGNSFADQFDGYVSETEKHFFESSLYIEQSLENVYARSKFEAEIAVLEAIYDGLPAQIMRMGNLTNRFTDGKFQKNYESNAFLQRIRAVLNLGVVPDYLMSLYSEFTPIDEAAEAVMTIARHFNNKQNVFHINSTKVVYLDKLLEHMNDLGCDMKTVSEKEFSAVLRKTMEQTQSKHIFEAFIGDMDENDRLNYDSNIRIENDFTVEYLRKLGFEWNDIDFKYIRKYVEYFRKIGFLEV